MAPLQAGGARVESGASPIRLCSTGLDARVTSGTPYGRVTPLFNW
jgi:hypothetical protein